MNDDINLIVQAANAAAHRAGKLILSLQHSNRLEVDSKDRSNNLVTNGDMEAERIIVDEITSKFPSHLILSEESAPEISPFEIASKPVWIIDPIDGTNNYAHGHSHFAISIAFAFKGSVKAGVVYAPALQETFSAVKGGGAWLNDQLIHVSQNCNLEAAVVSTGFPYDRAPILEVILENIEMVLSNCRSLRRYGSAALDLCWVACGRLDAHYELNLNPWDVAAGYLILKEAGGMVGKFDGSSFSSEEIPDLYSKEVLATSPGVFAKFAQRLVR